MRPYTPRLQRHDGPLRSIWAQHHRRRRVYREQPSPWTVAAVLLALFVVVVAVQLAPLVTP